MHAKRSVPPDRFVVLRLVHRCVPGQAAAGDDVYVALPQWLRAPVLLAPLYAVLRGFCVCMRGVCTMLHMALHPCIPRIPLLAAVLCVQRVALAVAAGRCWLCQAGWSGGHCQHAVCHGRH